MARQLGLIAVFIPILFSGYAPASPRPWPDTTRGVHVFSDQLAPWLSIEQVQFAATHYAGTQKVTRVEADRLRAINPRFLILHYRLGHGLGYRETSGACQPSGPYLAIVDGDEWVREWPGESVVQPSWFFPWAGQERVLNCDWGWYLMDVANPGYRAYWQAEVLRQLRANDNDGVFLDSLSVPNYLGAGSYQPGLPAVDPAFEAAWARRIEGWLASLRTQPIGQYHLVPNVGYWTTTRDTTDYAAADGLMVEGFAIEADQSPFAYEDWQLQMDRILAAVARGQAIIGQTYVTGDQERLFALGSYLLVKGNRAYLNIELGAGPEWWPGYDIPIGAPVDSAARIADLYEPVAGLYRRDFDDGFVLVNPTNPWDGSGVTHTVSLGITYYLAEPHGGGAVPQSGTPTGSLTYRPVTSITLGPYSAAVLLESRP